MNKLQIIGTNQGQRGDLIMGTVVARAIKEKFPNSYFSLGINKQYEDMAPLFYNHPYIDSVSIWEGYDNWPTQNDIQHAKQFDVVLSPMPQHPNSHCWYKLVNHQTEASCIMNGLTPPKDLQCYLTKYFEVQGSKDYIAISPFTAWDKKNISIEKWQSIIDYIVKTRGFNVLQLGGANEHRFENTFYPNDMHYSWMPWNYFESVKKMLGCTFTITLDGGLCWAASAYNHPTLGLMGLHYNGLNSSKLYQPINLNGHYLEAPRAEDIPNELIFQKIDEMIQKYY